MYLQLTDASNDATCMLMSCFSNGTNQGVGSSFSKQPSTHHKNVIFRQDFDLAIRIGATRCHKLDELDKLHCIFR